MKINKLVQVGTIEYQEEVVIPATYDNEGNELTPMRTELVTKTRPDMRPMNVDMTPEEEAEALASQAETEEWERNRPLTPEERMQELEDALVELASMLAEGGANG